MSWLSEKIFSYLSHKKKALLLILFFVFWGISIPNHTAQAAAWYDVLIGVFTGLPAAMIGVGLTVIVLLSGLLAAFGGLVLNWVLSPTFINWSYTNPTTNPIIKIGLDITQPFVNMILILVLVFIALATILRLGGYETKKLLPTFIIVALLVNFAPVICGLIVDASNIVMNFFTQNITGGKQLISTLKALGDSWKGLMGEETKFAATKQATLILNLVVLIIVNLALFLILLLFAFVFMVRYLAIWTLVILSPLAFACYILPTTKKVWTLWWNQFIQWAMIGITMAFFLYLADQFAVLNPTLAPGNTATTTASSATTCSYICSNGQTMGNSQTECDQLCQAAAGGSCEASPPGCTSTSTPPVVTGLGGAILPSLLPVVFLYLGFMFGLSTGAMGASGVIGFTKKAGKWTGAKVWRGASTWAQEKTHFREAAGAVTKKWESVPVARWFLPEKMRKYAEMRPAIDKSMEELKPYGDPEVAHRAAVGDIYGQKAAAALLLNINRGNSNDWFQQHLAANGIKYDPKDIKSYKRGVEELHGNKEYRTKMARLLQIALMGGYHNEIVRGAPRLAEFAVDAGYAGYKDIPGELAKDPKFAKLSEEEKRAAIRKAAIKRAVEESRPKHIQNYEEQDVFDRDVIESYMNRGRTEWQAIAGVKRGHLRPLEVMGDMFAEMYAKTTGKTIEKLAKASEKEIIKFWQDFEETNIKEGKAGIFLYLDSARAKETGWTRGKIIQNATGRLIEPPKKKKGKKPGEAVGMEGEQSEPSEGPQD